MRIPAVLILIASLTACNSGKKSSDAVRQGVVDYLVSKGFDVPKTMNVAITNLEQKGDQADATVSITPTGGDPKQGMAMKYHLEQKGEKWVVVGRPDSGSHGGGMAPGEGAPAGASPHGQMPPAGGGGSPHMPSPDELPPAKK